jgi:hypothetical protein
MNTLGLCVTTTARNPLNMRECCRPSVAVEKALGEPIRDALAARDSCAEVAAVPRTAMGSHLWDAG